MPCCPRPVLHWSSHLRTPAMRQLCKTTMRGVMLALAGPAILSAQADRVDAGSFSIFQDGQRVGREQFSFRRTPAPDGALYELRGETTRGDQQTAVQLTTDSSGTPMRYSVETRDDAKVTLRLGGQRVRGRFAILSRTADGESAREYLLAAGTIAVEGNLFHQLCFLVRGRPATARIFIVSVLSPLDNTQQAWRVSLEAAIDSVTIAGVVKPARRWRVDEATGVYRTLWADNDGRILRVVIPARRIEAIRDDVPRP